MKVLWHRVLFLFTVNVSLIFTSGIATADSKQFQFGKLALTYDSTVWQVTAHGANAWHFDPVEPETRGSVRLVVLPMGNETCEDLAKLHLPLPLYYQRQSSRQTFARLPVDVVTSHTGCRNATPVGIAACVPYGGSAHLFVESISSCRHSGFGWRKGQTVDQLLMGLVPLK